MNTPVENDQAIVEEAINILLERMPASKVARLCAVWQLGRGDYLKHRETLFSGETVDSLYLKLKDQ
jgi:hypothetical protein